MVDLTEDETLNDLSSQLSETEEDKSPAVDPKNTKPKQDKGLVTLEEKPKGDYNSAAGYAVKEAGRAISGGVKKYSGGLGDILDTFSIMGQVMNKDSLLRKNVDIPWIKTERSISNIVEDSLDFADEPKSIGGKITQDLVQFGLGWATGSKLLAPFKPVKALKGFKAKSGMELLETAKRAGKLATFEMGASGLGTFIASDPHAERLSDFLQTYPALQNPVLDYVFDTLESDEQDSTIEGKLKAGLEDVITAGGVEIVFKGVKLFKEGMRVWLKKGDKGYAKFLDAHVDTMREATGRAESRGWEEVHAPPTKVDLQGTEVGDLRSPTIKQHLSEQDEVLKRGSGDTQISRKAPSKLVNVLTGLMEKAAEGVKGVKGVEGVKEAGIKLGRVLHAGAGKINNPDRQALNKLSDNNTVHYDPENVGSEEVAQTLGKQDFDTVLSPYVMNTLPPKVRKEAYIQMSHSMKDDGFGLVTVRGEGNVVPNKGWKEYEDGWIVPKRGKNATERFQKGYSKESLEKELKVHFKEVEIIKGDKGSVTARVKGPKRTEQATGKTFQVDLDNIQMSASDVATYIAKVNDVAVRNTFEGEIERGELLRKVVNWDKMEGDEGAVKVLKALADTIRNDKKFKVVDVQSNAETVARATGMPKGSHLIDRMASMNMATEDMASLLVASKDMLMAMSRQIYDVAKRAEKGSHKDKIDLVKLIHNQGELFTAVKGVQRSAARATQAGRIKVYGDMSKAEVRELIDGAGGDVAIEKMARRIRATEGDPMAINRLTQKSSIEKIIDVHNEYWIASILGGFKTHVVNVTAGSMNTFWLPAQKAVGALLRGDTETAKEGMMQIVYLRTALRDALEMARKAFVVEDAILDSTNKTLDTTALKAIQAKNFGMDDSVGKEEDIIHWLGVKGVNFLGHLVRMPNRFLMAEDEFFKQINYRAAMKAKLYGEALRLGKSTKKMAKVHEKGKIKHISEVDEYVERNLDASINEFGQGQAGTEAMNMARGSTFTDSIQDMEGRFGNWGGSLQSFVNRNPFFRGWLLPFVRVPTNLLRTAVDNSPLGALTMRFQKTMQAGTKAEKALIQGKLATGSLMWLYASSMAAENRITGGAPKDKELRGSAKATGWQPYSFVTGDFTLDENGKLVEDNRKYYSFQRLDPFGIPFGIAADIKRIYNKVDQGVYENFISVATLAMANNLGSKSYLKGLLDTFKILEDEDGSVTQRYFRTRAGSYIPNAFGMMDFVNEDDAMKDVRTVLDGILAKIPGVSDVVEAKRDLFGGKILPPDGQPMHSFNPFTVSEAKNDPVRFEMNRLAEGAGEGQFASMPKKITRNVDLTQFRNSKGQSAYDRAQELMGIVKNGRGETLHDRLKRTISSDSYNRGDLEALDGSALNKRGKRAVKIGEQLSKYKERALKKLLKEFDSEFKAGKLGGQMSLKDLVKQDKKNQRLASRGRATVDLDDFIN